MVNDLVELTKALVNIPSVSRWSNTAVSDYLQEVMRNLSFTVERLTYVDVQGELKVSLVGQLGQGTGGLAFFSHTDTVPGQEQAWPAFAAVVENGRLYGRGSCDMKGPLAATLLAAASFDTDELKQPVFVIATADEEIGGYGAQQVVVESQLLAQAGTRLGVIAEPTNMIPIYAHKGGATMTVTANGWAAHTSTDAGISANFPIAPFLAEMAELAAEVKRDPSYWNDEFTPPTIGFNMVLDDGNCALNVSAAKTVCRVGFRTMPHDRTADLVTMITAKAQAYGLAVECEVIEPFYVAPSAEIIQLACRTTGHDKAQTVPYGTDAFFLKEKFELVILGPGDIQLAHTVGEYVPVADLERAVMVYQRMITAVCA